MGTEPPPHLQLTGHHGTPPPLRLTGRQRRRRRLLPALALLLLVTVTVAGLLSGSAPAPLRVSIRDTAYGPVHRAGFVGLSIEYPALASYLGPDPAHIDPIFAALVRALAPGGAPMLRIGGDSADHAYYAPDPVDPPAGLSYRITPAWIAAARALADETGARFVLDLDLAAGRPSLAAREADAMLSGIGARHVAALEIGNEPDIYARAPWFRAGAHVGYARGPRWSERRFYAQFAQFARALPALPLAGPAYAERTWIGQLPQFLAGAPRIGLVTDHRYPLRGCLGHTADAPTPTIAHLMAPAASTGLAASVAPYVAAAHRAGLPFRIDEINSAACRGRLGVSNTFASALWAVQTLFALAAVGVDGVNLHTLPGAPYEPFTVSDPPSGWRAQVRPIYYGLLFFARAFPPGARLLRARAPAAVEAWATRSPNGRLRIVLINPRARTVRVAVTTPPGSSPRVLLQRLQAPSLRATGGVTIGGRAFSGSTLTGVLPSPRHCVVRAAHGQLAVSVPGPGAVLLTG
jgi:hypothetical protein